MVVLNGGLHSRARSLLGSWPRSAVRIRSGPPGSQWGGFLLDVPIKSENLIAALDPFMSQVGADTVIAFDSFHAQEHQFPYLSD